VWLYDWQDNELREHGPAAALVGWRDDAQGFLVVRGTPPDETHFEVIQQEFIDRACAGGYNLGTELERNSENGYARYSTFSTGSSRV
jgi:hypothetical protein